MSKWPEQTEAVAAAAGAPRIPIWITETGVSTTAEAGAPVALTPQQQATDLLTMIHIAQADPHVGAMFIFSLQDAAPDAVQDLVDAVGSSTLNWSPFQHGALEGIGVFTSNWAPKPDACAISAAWGGSLTC
jgi:hypothetical protein